MKFNPEKHDVIDEKPFFESLVEIWKGIESVKDALVGLADDLDTTQRATDLVCAGESLSLAINDLCLSIKDAPLRRCVEPINLLRK